MLKGSVAITVPREELVQNSAPANVIQDTMEVIAVKVTFETEISSKISGVIVYVKPKAQLSLGLGPCSQKLSRNV